jgi:hypothetical protein
MPQPRNNTTFNGPWKQIGSGIAAKAILSAESIRNQNNDVNQQLIENLCPSRQLLDECLLSSVTGFAPVVYWLLHYLGRIRT